MRDGLISTFKCCRCSCECVRKKLKRHHPVVWKRTRFDVEPQLNEQPHRCQGGPDPDRDTEKTGARCRERCRSLGIVIVRMAVHHLRTLLSDLSGRTCPAELALRTCPARRIRSAGRVLKQIIYESPSTNNGNKPHTQTAWVVFWSLSRDVGMHCSVESVSTARASQNSAQRLFGFPLGARSL